MAKKRTLAWGLLVLGALGLLVPPIWLFTPGIGLAATMQKLGANLSGAPQSPEAYKASATATIVFLAWFGTGTLGMILMIVGGVLLVLGLRKPSGLPRPPPPPPGAPTYPPRTDAS